ncbi:MAG: Branched-chain amino acid transporter, amino acid-binding protein [Candidatus Brocadiaceae bacterium]|nr:Branched-chain amino acid transporter, amino acid-binding protein [Candidatus Brocadiaceae bacterium]
MKSITYRLPLVLWCLVALFLLTAFTSIKIFAYSSGPPDGRTGSPADGFQTCNDIGCHNSYPLNSGSAIFSLSAPTSYTLGETLSISISFGNSSTLKHGFELSALDANNNHVGTFSSVDGDGNTQTSNGDYIKHTSAGSSQSGNASWNVQWTSPTSEVQNPVTFYAAGNEANGDSTNQGDYIYTTTTQISSVVSTPTTTPSATPVVTPTPTPSTSVTPKIAAEGSAYGHYSLALKSDGTMWSWGYNTVGQLGDGTYTNRNTPVKVKNLYSNIVDIACGGAITLALKSTGTVWQWGNGLGTTPKRFDDLDGVKAIASGTYHHFAIKNDGTLWAWGDNEYGQLGNGKTTDSHEKPVQVSGISDVVAVAGGMYHSIALKSDGTVWTWGWNNFGQLGNGTKGTNEYIPIQVNDLSNVTAIAASWYWSFALKSDGTLWGWGYNAWGQLGDGTRNDRSSPIQSGGGLSDIIAIAGSDFTLVLRKDGTVWGWGSNNGGLGNNIDRGQIAYDPLQISGIDNVIAIAAGMSHALALKSDGTVWAWGSNYYGQIGNGEGGDDGETALYVDTPVQVKDLNLYASTPSSNGIIFGFVDDEEDDALEGVTVTLDGADHSESVETDKEGFYEFRNLLAGDYTLTYEKDGFQTYTESISLLDGEIKEIRTITLEKVVPTPTPSPTPSSSNIFGFVYDSEEEPIQDVTVTIKGDNYSGSTSTDEYGYYELKNLLSGDYTLTYNKEGYQTKTKDITLEEKENLDLGIITLELVEKGSIFGYVTDFRGYEIDSATIRMKGLNTGYSKTISSDTDGYFEFTDLEADTYILTAKKSGYKQGKRIVKLSEGEARDVELKMKRKRTTSVQSQF